jgi:uncharacterized protein
MIVDFHTHIFPPAFCRDRDRFFSGEPGFDLLYRPAASVLISAEDLLREMDRVGVDRSVVFGFPWEKSDHYRRHNDYILESVQRHPGRLSGLCCFSPLSPGGIEEAERGFREGLSGVGELAVYHEPWGDRCFRQLGNVAELCARRDRVLLLHVNEPVGHSYPGKTTAGLEDFYRLLKVHPSTRFILAHWGGGLFFYGLMKKEVRDVLRNTWFDTAASPFLFRPEVYRIAGEILGFEKILFGSDYPLISPGRYFSEMEEAGIPPEAVLRIRGQNGSDLLKTVSP